MKVTCPISFSKGQVNKNKNTTKDFYGYLQAKTPFTAKKSPSLLKHMVSIHLGEHTVQQHLEQENNWKTPT